MATKPSFLRTDTLALEEIATQTTKEQLEAAAQVELVDPVDPSTPLQLNLHPAHLPKLDQLRLLKLDPTESLKLDQVPHLQQPPQILAWHPQANKRLELPQPYSHLAPTLKLELNQALSPHQPALNPPQQDLIPTTLLEKTTLVTKEFPLEIRTCTWPLTHSEPCLTETKDTPFSVLESPFLEISLLLAHLSETLPTNGVLMLPGTSPSSCWH